MHERLSHSISYMRYERPNAAKTHHERLKAQSSSFKRPLSLTRRVIRAKNDRCAAERGERLLISKDSCFRSVKTESGIVPRSFEAFNRLDIRYAMKRRSDL